MTGEERELHELLSLSQRRNMSDRLFDQIGGLIQDGTLQAGYVFPNETVLCQQLNVGRSTVREAYKALELAGYISRSKKGTVVNEPAVILASTPLRRIAEQSSHDDFVEFRIMLEMQTAVSAAERANEDDIEILAGIHKELVEKVHYREPEVLSALDVRFHKQIAESTHNTMIIAAMQAVSSAWRQQVEKNFRKAVLKNPMILDRMATQHEGILQAIRDKNAAEAKERMREHILDMSGM